MLEKLHIKNVAVIEELEIDFKKGFNVLTGETGAGKSIIIDSLNFVLGEKADKELIRTGAETAEVTAVFSVHDKETEDGLVDLDVRIDEEGCILINRSFSLEGKSSCKVNGLWMFTVSMTINRCLIRQDILKCLTGFVMTA